jgi:hypothetical protein
MVFAIRHGVLGYEAMGLNRLFKIFPFGVQNYEATRLARKRERTLDAIFGTSLESL